MYFYLADASFHYSRNM